MTSRYLKCLPLCCMIVLRETKRNIVYTAICEHVETPTFVPLPILDFLPCVHTCSSWRHCAKSAPLPSTAKCTKVVVNTRTIGAPARMSCVESSGSRLLSLHLQPMTRPSSVLLLLLLLLLSTLDAWSRFRGNNV